MFSKQAGVAVSAALILVLSASQLPTAKADCSDRTYDCILGANVVYDSTTMSGNTVGAGCTASLEAQDCMVSGMHSSSDSLQFMAKGASAGSLTVGRCFELFSGCLPNNCGANYHPPEDLCNQKHPQCGGSCTATCTDACKNT